MLGVVASLLAVVCKLKQQLPTMLRPAVHREKDKTHKTLQPPMRPCVVRVRGPNNVGRAVQKFDRFQTLRNNMQQGVQTDATFNIQQCWELLANNVASVCMGHSTCKSRPRKVAFYPNQRNSNNLNSDYEANGPLFFFWIPYVRWQKNLSIIWFGFWSFPITHLLFLIGMETTIHNEIPTLTSESQYKYPFSPIYTAETFWRGSDESGTRTKKIVLISYLHVFFFFYRAKRCEIMIWYG